MPHRPDERRAGLGNPRELAKRRSEVFHVIECEGADDGVEAVVGQRGERRAQVLNVERCRESFAALSRQRDHLRCDVDAVYRRALLGEPRTVDTRAAAGIENMQAADAAEQVARGRALVKGVMRFSHGNLGVALGKTCVSGASDRRGIG